MRELNPRTPGRGHKHTNKQGREVKRSRGQDGKGEGVQPWPRSAYVLGEGVVREEGGGEAAERARQRHGLQVHPVPVLGAACAPARDILYKYTPVYKYCTRIICI